MKKYEYVVTAEIVDKEQDGLNPDDGMPVYRLIHHRRTWTVGSDMKIGDIMERVEKCFPHTITITASEKVG